MKFVHFASPVIIVFYMGRLATALIIATGGCPKRPVVQNFDVSRYGGLWYEIKRYEQPFQFGGECTTAEYSLNRDGSVRVFNSMLVPPRKRRNSIVGRAVLSHPNEFSVPAKLQVTFNGVPVASNYWVLDTDYDNFAVVWSCFQLGSIIHTEGSWILSREPILNASVAPRVQATIDKYLNGNHFRTTMHDAKLCCSTESNVTTYPSCNEINRFIATSSSKSHPFSEAEWIF